MPEIHDQPDPQPHDFSNTEGIDGTNAEVDAAADMLCPTDYRDDEGEEGYSDGPYTYEQGHMPITTRLIRTVILREDGTYEPAGLADSVLDELDTLYTTTADEVYAQFGQDREGLDLGRTRAFVDGLGVTATDKHIIIPRSSGVTLKKALIPIEGAGQIASDILGFYAIKSDTAVVYRDRALEQENGPELTEALQVHELMHSGGRVEIQVTTSGNGLLYAAPSRFGHVVAIYNGELLSERIVGNFIEEGVAQQGFGRYVKEVLGKPQGFAEVDKHIVATNAGRLAVPPEHTVIGKDGLIVTPNAAIAARALGHLIDRDPALWPALIAGARDDEAFTEVRGRINAIAPGMFEHLQGNYNDKTLYGHGVLYVCNRLGIWPDRL